MEKLFSPSRVIHKNLLPHLGLVLSSVLSLSKTGSSSQYNKVYDPSLFISEEVISYLVFEAPENCAPYIKFSCNFLDLANNLSFPPRFLITSHQQISTFQRKKLDTKTQ